MSAARRARLIEAVGQQPVPLVTERYEALRLWSDGSLKLIAELPTFEDALDHAKLTSLHKDKFVIRRTSLDTGDQVLSVYVVKQKSQPVYVYVDHEKRRVQPMYAEHLHDIKLPGAGA